MRLIVKHHFPDLPWKDSRPRKEKENPEDFCDRSKFLVAVHINNVTLVIMITKIINSAILVIMITKM